MPWETNSREKVAYSAIIENKEGTDWGTKLQMASFYGELLASTHVFTTIIGSNISAITVHG